MRLQEHTAQVKSTTYHCMYEIEMKVLCYRQNSLLCHCKISYNYCWTWELQGRCLSLKLRGGNATEILFQLVCYEMQTILSRIL